MTLFYYILITAFFLLMMENVVAEEDIQLFEGDMAMGEESRRIIEGHNVGYKAAFHWKWPGKTIPYQFDSKLGEGLDRARRAAIHTNALRIKVTRQAMKEFERVTCLRFKQRTTEFNYLKIENTNRGCWSWIGLQKNRNGQSVSIGPNCEYVFVVMHELMHALGFFHEQSRLDRDKYVDINYHNIQKGQEYNFKKYGKGYADTYGEPYDLYSLMHYRRNEFSKNGGNTIQAKGRPYEDIGNTKGFSQGDIRQINKMYGCKM